MAEAEQPVPTSIKLVVYSGAHITAPNPAAQIYLSMLCGSEKFTLSAHLHSHVPAQLLTLNLLPNSTKSVFSARNHRKR
jgi:hypothetical protein